MQFARSRLLRIFLRLLLVAGGAFLALVLVVTVFYEAEVKQKIISELNRHLRSEIKASDFDISPAAPLPFASFEMKEVTAMDAVAGKESDTLLRAERISLQFNLAGLLRKDIVIRRITANDGFIRLRIDEQGEPNYIIWKTDSTAATGSGGIDLSLVPAAHGCAIR